MMSIVAVTLGCSRAGTSECSGLGTVHVNDSKAQARSTARITRTRGVAIDQDAACFPRIVQRPCWWWTQGEQHPSRCTERAGRSRSEVAPDRVGVLFAKHSKSKAAKHDPNRPLPAVSAVTVEGGPWLVRPLTAPYPRSVRSRSRVAPGWSVP